MSANTYSTRVQLLQDKKTIKTTLTLSLDKYLYDSYQEKVDWKHVQCKTGTAEVKKFIFTFKLPYIIICNNGHESPAFMLRKWSFERLLKKIAYFRELSEKRREEIIRTIHNKNIRIKDEVNNIGAIRKIDLIKNSSDPAIRNAWNIIGDNPYRILGLSVSASIEEANSAFDKIKKLSRINALESFKSDFHLNGVTKPNRDVSIVQNSLILLNNPKFSWMWFLESDTCKAWQNTKYRKELSIDGLQYGSYDLFLANYLYAVFFDPMFEKEQLWRPVFDYYSYICSDPNHLILKKRAQNLTVIKDRSWDDVFTSFNDFIFKPVEVLCETSDIDRIIRAYKLIKDTKGNYTGNLKNKIGTNITRWFTSQGEEVQSFVNKFENHFNPKDLPSISKELNRFICLFDSAFESSHNAVKDEKIRKEMIEEAYCHSMWELMSFIYATVKNDRCALELAKRAFPYCNEKQKRTLASTFGSYTVTGSKKQGFLKL